MADQHREACAIDLMDAEAVKASIPTYSQLRAELSRLQAAGGQGVEQTNWACQNSAKWLDLAEDGPGRCLKPCGAAICAQPQKQRVLPEQQDPLSGQVKNSSGVDAPKHTPNPPAAPALVPLTDAEFLTAVRSTLSQAIKQPGVAFKFDHIVAEEAKKFMRGEPSRFDRLPFGEVTALADGINGLTVGGDGGGQC